MKPLLSIVIANYNYGRFLEEAIQSVIAQDMGDQVELIICDAASTDNSVEIIKKYANGLPSNTPRSEWEADNQRPTTNNQRLITWWCSEPDGGQSEAFNKGFSHAKGRFLTWLNADDVLLPGTVKALVHAAEKWPECEWFVGGVMWLDKEMRIMKAIRARQFSELRFKTGQLTTWGPSSFFTRHLFEAVGGVDNRFEYAMDVDLWRRFAHEMKARYRAFCKYAWGFRFHESAKTSGHHFEASGKCNPNHPMWKQLRLEEKWKAEHYTPPLKSNWFRRICSIDVGAYIGGLCDTLRFSGCHYTDYFKG